MYIYDGFLPTLGPYHTENAKKKVKFLLSKNFTFVHVLTAKLESDSSSTCVLSDLV